MDCVKLNLIARVLHGLLSEYACFDLLSRGTCAKHSAGARTFCRICLARSLQTFVITISNKPYFHMTVLAVCYVLKVRVSGLCILQTSRKSILQFQKIGVRYFHF